MNINDRHILLVKHRIDRNTLHQPDALIRHKLDREYLYRVKDAFEASLIKAATAAIERQLRRELGNHLIFQVVVEIGNDNSTVVSNNENTVLSAKIKGACQCAVAIAYENVCMFKNFIKL